MRRLRRRPAALAGVLALGALLAWALPALAGPGRAPSRPRPVTAAAARRASLSHLATAATVTPVARRTGTRRHAAAHHTPPLDWHGIWSAPFRVSAPVGADLIAPLSDVDAGGLVSVASGTTDEDAPQNARAELLFANARNVFAARRAVPDAQQVLALAHLGHREILLDGSSSARQSCCSTAIALSESRAGGSGTAQPIAAGLEGTTTGALVPVHGGLLAVVDNQAGITVARSDASGSFGPAEQLIAGQVTPSLMAAAPLSDGGAVVAWTAPAAGAQAVTGTTTAPGQSTTASGYDQPQNDLIEFATDGPSGLPGAPRLALSVPAGRWIDALAVVPHRSGATIAWTESWFVGAHYRSAVFWADLRSGAQPVQLSDGGTAAVGLSMAAAPGGHQVLAWQACDVPAGSCRASAALRPHGAAWSAVRTLGPVDPLSFPVATESARGQALVGWISGGEPYASPAAPGAGDFLGGVPLARTTGATDLTLGFGAGARAIAVWVQGTVDQKLIGARFTPLVPAAASAGPGIPAR